MNISKNDTVDSNNSTSDREKLDLRTFQIVFLIITIVATVLGNALVLAAIILDRRLRNVTNYFVACLAVSDLLVGCFSVTIRLYQYLELSGISIHICRFWSWIDISCSAASITTLTIISIDRYFKISRPFTYRNKVTKTVAVVVSIWVYAAMFATIGLIPHADAQGVTVTTEGKCRNNNRIFYTLAAVLAFFFPLAILIVMYTLIFRIALYHFRKSHAVTFVNASGKQLHYSAHKDLKATRTLFIVVSTFVVCWGPFFTLFLVQQYRPSALHKLSFKLYSVLAVIFFVLLPSANSFFNPIIYACFDMVYRRSFRKIIFRLVGRSEYLANSSACNNGKSFRTNEPGSVSEFEMAVTRPRESLTSSTRSPRSVHEEARFSFEKVGNGRQAPSPSRTLITWLGSKEMDSML